MRGRIRQTVSRIVAVTVIGCCLLGSVTAAQGSAQEAADQIRSAAALVQAGLDANAEAVKVILEGCTELLGEEDPVSESLSSVLFLLEQGGADSSSVEVLLQGAIEELEGRGEDGQNISDEVPAAETEQAETGSAPAAEAEQAETGSAPAAETSQSLDVPQFPGLADYEVSAFIQAILHDCVLIDVPLDWGNNYQPDRAMATYSPVNASGAISPLAGTLSVSYVPLDGEEDAQAYDTYQRNVASMSVVTALTADDVEVAGITARKMDFTMCVGANLFTCEAVCFAHDNTLYVIELMQGQESDQNYFPAYQHSVLSAQVAGAEAVAEARRALEEALAQTGSTGDTETQPATEVPQPVTETPQPATEVPQPATETPQPVTEVPQPATEVPQPATEEVPQPATEVPQPATETPQPVTETPLPADSAVEFEGDMGDFLYRINGHTYAFPTAVHDLKAEDLPLDHSLTMSYDLHTDADMEDGTWTEISNTEYFYFENSLYKEMAGVTNLTGSAAAMDDCMLTALIDTKGSRVDVTLPGDVRVGGAESDILRGFPAFSQVEMNGNSAFRGNELLCACNVRDDGCHGYVLIRNDAPYYSAVSIICEDSVIREISFECLGDKRAEGIFLED